MKSRNQQAKPARRERRAFTEEFKRQAVQLLHERRAQGVSVTQIGRERDVKPDQLREWARRLAAQEGGSPEPASSKRRSKNSSGSGVRTRASRSSRPSSGALKRI